MYTILFPRGFVIAAAGLLTLLAYGSPAPASLVLSIDENGTSWNVPTAGTGPLIGLVTNTTDYSADTEVGKVNGNTLTISSTITRKSTAGNMPLTVELEYSGFTLPTGLSNTLTSSFEPTLTPATNNDSVTFNSSIYPTSNPLLAISTASQSFSPAASPTPETLQTPDTVSSSFASTNGLFYTVGGIATFNLGPGDKAQLVETITFTPEPAALSLICLGAVGFLRRRRI